MLGRLITRVRKALAKRENTKHVRVQRMEIDCHHCGAFDYNYKYRSLNSGWIIDGARPIGRDGCICNECGRVSFFDTDEEFVNGFLQYSHNHWLAIHSKSIPEKYLKYVPQELLDKRAERIHNDGVRKLQKEMLHIEAELPVMEKRLKELLSMKEDGKLTELATA